MNLQHLINVSEKKSTNPHAYNEWTNVAEEHFDNLVYIADAVVGLLAACDEKDTKKAGEYFELLEKLVEEVK